MFGHSEQSENTAIRLTTQGQNGARARPVIQNLESILPEIDENN